jgi:peptide/nickel transport system ATP-binding protein
MQNKILEVHQLSKKFIKSLDKTTKVINWLGGSYKEEVVHAVDNVSFDIMQGEVVGVVGESGCGKSTLGRMIAGIMPITSGSISFKEKHYAGFLDNQYQQNHSIDLKIQMIFQDPFSSLNPRKKVLDIISEAPIHHQLISKEDKKNFVAEMLNKVGLNNDAMARYPHQFSGGQRQRVGIARALAVSPELVVCDESVAALDVSIQAQIINLFLDLRKNLNLTYLFISHDMGVIEHIADRIVVMYLGQVVEIAPTNEIINRTNHPYTKALLGGVPTLDTTRKMYEPIKGEIPSPLNPPSGCYFHPRCKFATEKCKLEKPSYKEVAPNHFSACHLNDQNS